jgi:hypothetical protein
MSRAAYRLWGLEKGGGGQIEIRKILGGDAIWKCKYTETGQHEGTGGRGEGRRYA